MNTKSVTSSAEVQNFISRFTPETQKQHIEYVFTNGCCYWFAYILQSRFSEKEAVIMYDEVMNHFGTEIDGRVYDVTGDVTEKYIWLPWHELQDELHKERIIRDCVQF